MNAPEMDFPGSPPASMCGACGSDELELIGVLPLYVRGGSVQTPIRKCRACGTYIRGVDFNDIARRGHFDVASYTDPSTEAHLFRSRHDFFGYLMALAARHLRRPLSGARVLDVGCSFGHLLDLLKAEGAQCAGVEIVEELRARLAARDIRALRSIDAIPRADIFDLITLIDSVYCFDRPEVELRRLYQHLVPDGLLLVRITNRAPLLSCLRVLRRPITNDHLGDAKYNFSFRGIKALLNRTGFAIERVYWHERGKRGMRPATWLYYRLTLAASVLLRRPLTPGLILICRPQQ